MEQGASLGEVLVAHAVAAWQVHNDVTLALLEAIPGEGFSAVPLASRGRSVARQLLHVHQVRLGWLHHHRTGERPRRDPRREDPGRAELVAAFQASGAAVGDFLAPALRGEARVRMFGGNPMRWLGYLIAHESHHRGQVALALKQNGMRLPEKVAVQGLWGRWMFGR